MILLLLVAVLSFVCFGCVDEPIALTATVESTVEVGRQVTVNAQANEGAKLSMTVTFGDENENVETDGLTFIAAKKGDYAIKVVAKMSGNEETKELTVKAVDLTAPVITAKPNAKTVVKGNYDFTDDLSEIAATDNGSAADALTVWLKEIRLGEKKTSFVERQTTFEFTEAGIYTVVFAVCDEEENQATDSYQITVMGIKGTLAKEEYSIGESISLPEIEKIGSDGALSFEYIKGEDSVSVSESFALYEAGEYTLKVTLETDGNVSDVLNLAFTVSDINVSSDVILDEFYNDGDTLVVPSFVSDNAAAELSVLLIGADETAVSAGQTIALHGGSYVLRVIVECGEYSKAHDYEFYCRYPGEVVSFEASGSSFDGGNYDAMWGNGEIETGPEFVKYGKQSMRFTVGSDAKVGLTWYSGLRKYTEVENANAIRMWVYVEENPALDSGKTWGYARFKVHVQTGVAPTNFNKFVTEKIYKIPTGEWAEIVVRLSDGACAWEDGLAALALEQYDPTGNWNWASHMTFRLDGIVASHEEKPVEETLVGFEPLGTSHDGAGETYGTATVNTDPAYVKTGNQSIKLNVNESATAGFAWWSTNRKYTEVENANAIKLWIYVTETTSYGQARLLFKVETGDNSENTYKRVATGIKALKTNQWNEVTIILDGSECDLANGLTAVYFQQYDPTGDWTWASTMNFYVDDIRACRVTEQTLVGFEAVGASHDGAGETYGTATVNTDPAYVKTGNQSIKLNVNESATAGFAWWSTNRKYTNIKNANAIKLWIYVTETTSYGQARLLFKVETGDGDTYKSVATEILELKTNQWNEVTIKLDGSECDLANGLTSVYFRQYDPTGDWTWASTMNFYVDDIRAAKV